MIWLGVIVFLVIIFYLYKTSKNEIFLLPKEDLSIIKEMMINQLYGYGRSKAYVRLACVAFDYFALHPEKFDGSTIVRDLYDVFYKGYRLSVSSLIHDFIWVRFLARMKMFLNWWSNWKYFKDLLKNGKPPMYFRLAGLMLISLFYVPIMYVKYKIK